MATRKYHRKSNKFRKTRSKKQRGGDVNDLIQASFNGDILKVKKLLEEGADINAKDEDGMSALQMASSDGHTDIVNLLLEEGADVNAKNEDGKTALQMASSNGDTDIVKLLLEAGADVNAKDNDWGTALSDAVIHEKQQDVKLLLENGADVNQPNKDGETPIIHAIDFGDVEIVKMLLENPMLHIYPRDDGNYYEVELAKDMNENEIADLLNKYIKTRNQKDDNIEELSNYKRPNISSLKTMAYYQGPSALDTHINLNPGTINRPYGKLGGKRKTRKKNSRGRKTRKKNSR